MPNMNAKNTPWPEPGSARIKDQGVYKTIAGYRRSRTLTNEQLSPEKNSKPRRKLYKTGVATFLPMSKK